MKVHNKFLLTKNITSVIIFHFKKKKMFLFLEMTTPSSELLVTTIIPRIFRFAPPLFSKFMSQQIEELLLSLNNSKSPTTETEIIIKISEWLTKSLPSHLLKLVDGPFQLAKFQSAGGSLEFTSSSLMTRIKNDDDDEDGDFSGIPEHLDEMIFNDNNNNDFCDEDSS